MKREQKESKQINWYKNNGTGSNSVEYKSVLFVPVTKGGILAKELKKTRRGIE